MSSCGTKHKAPMQLDSSFRFAVNLTKTFHGYKETNPTPKQVRALVHLTYIISGPILYMAEGTVFDDHVDLEWECAGQTVCIQIGADETIRVRVQRRMDARNLIPTELPTDWFPWDFNWRKVKDLLTEMYKIRHPTDLGEAPLNYPSWMLEEAINILKFVQTEGLHGSYGREDTKNMIRKFFTTIGLE